MSTLIVVGFKKDMYRASSVLNRLLEMNYDWVIDLHDAVAVYRDYSGKLRVDQSYQLTTGEGAAAGGFFGSLIGLTVGAIAAPFTAGASLAAGAVGGGAIGAVGGALDAKWWKEDFGIPEDFVADVGTLVQPGDSAIYALLRTANPVTVAEQFRGYGGTVLSSTLTPEQSKKVQSMLEGNK
jgi:uncharacterized membrane protein